MKEIKNAIENYNSIGRGITTARLDASGGMMKITISEPWKAGAGFTVASFTDEKAAVNWIIKKMAKNGVAAAKYSNL